ncbi:MAG: RsmF rRNA methyltransferase first C-terminal domain-containing protein [Clostridia bacterium]|nr:RsmF rRNA methyltransferase first C-terminal domain-containing protein [Clostridia bacterium]
MTNNGNNEYDAVTSGTKRLPGDFVEDMRGQLGAEAEAFFASYSEPAVRGLRVNTDKLSVAEFSEITPWSVEPGGLSDDYLVLRDEAFSAGKHPLHLAGAFYLCDPSTALPIVMADIRRGMWVLDMCAAPGGKAGAAAARLGGEGVIVANDAVTGRARVLSRTLERLGAVNAVCTSASPDAVAAAYGARFDRVLVDAPCSGEGMFRKDPAAALEWSREHVRACAARQRLILDSAARCVAPGGRLIYSTCTFNSLENEENARLFLAAHGEFELLDERRLYPHSSVGEGHYCAVFASGGEAGPRRAAEAVRGHRRCGEACVNAFLTENFRMPFGAPYIDARGAVRLMGADTAANVTGLFTLGAGVYAGEVKKGRFEPAHALYMASQRMGCRHIVEFEADSPQLGAFLRGVELESALSGFTAVHLRRGGVSLPIGFAKASAGRLKSRYPKGLRLT